MHGVGFREWCFGMVRELGDLVSIGRRTSWWKLIGMPPAQGRGKSTPVTSCQDLPGFEAGF